MLQSFPSTPRKLKYRRIQKGIKLSREVSDALTKHLVAIGK